MTLPEQILRDVPKSRREVDLHWRTCSHPNIVNLIDVYENVFMGHRSLLVVMEWWVSMLHITLPPHTHTYTHLQYMYM